MCGAIVETVTQRKQDVHLVSRLKVSQGLGSFTYNLYEELNIIDGAVYGMN